MFLGDVCKLKDFPNDGTCLGEPPGGFCDVGCCCCHSLLFNVIPHSSVSYRQVFTPILYFQPSLSQSDSRHFNFNFSGPFCYSFTASTTVLTGRFLPTGVFLPMSLLPDIFDTTCFYQGLRGSQQFFLEVSRASCWSSKHRPSLSVCLGHNNPQKRYSGRFYLWFTAGRISKTSAPHEI